ncbi:MAG: DUF1569 domain-containing protein [Leptospiraceae bacterium]|nr:DUF1569 domain-containing protein [Leptospiraceae bacterium]
MIAINTRKCVFTDFVQVLEQIEVLEKTQFVETTGVWSFYQILRHCTEHIQFSMTQFPYTYNPFLRKTVGKYLLAKILDRGYMMPDGYSGQIETVRIEGDDKLALSQLKSAIYAFRKFHRDFAIHPLYDEMDKPTWEKFHSIHIANHLSFVETFPIEMNYEDGLEEKIFEQNLQTEKQLPILTIHSLNKLEAQDGLVGKRRSKSKMNSVVRKRKR